MVFLRMASRLSRGRRINLATGWGSFNGANLLADLAPTPTPAATPTPSPTPGTISVLPQPRLSFETIGTGTDKSKILSIKNNSKSGTLAVTVGILSAPYTVTVPGGASSFTLSPGQNKAVTVNFAPILPPVNSSATLIITSDNQTSVGELEAQRHRSGGQSVSPGAYSFPKHRGQCQPY